VTPPANSNAELRALFRSMRRIARAVELHSRRLDDEFGLTFSQHIVLRSISDLGEVTSRTIGNAAGLSPAAMVAVLDRLEEKGLIERYRSTRDRRIVHTRLTANGRAVLEHGAAPFGSGFEAAFMALDKQIRAQMITAAEKIADIAAQEENLGLDEPASR